MDQAMGSQGMERRGLLGRRHLPLLAVPLLARQAAAAPANLRFRIMREGSAIGTHRVVFTEAAGRLTAATEVAIQVKLMSFTVFRLNHLFTEVWADGRLASVTSRHERNGTVTEMSGRAGPGGILVQGPEGASRRPAEAAPLSWWDSRHFAGPLFHNRTGKLLRVQWARSALPGGGTRWRASGEADGEASYAADGSWLDWKTTGEDGSLVTYERA
jgi:hypothetical protein